MEIIATDCWNTPGEIWTAIYEFMPRCFDPCPPAPQFDGTKESWVGDCYINPPYSRKLKRSFIDKAFDEYSANNRYLWMFNYANSEDLNRVHQQASVVLIPFKRFRFIPGHHALKESSPRYDNIMILWGNPQGFAEAFGKFGKVYYTRESDNG